MTVDGVQLVISRFDEDTSWLHDVVYDLVSHVGCVEVFVYNKGSTDIGDMRHRLSAIPCVSLKETLLPNVGRESHTYLEHVLRLRQTSKTPGEYMNWVTVFMQGKMADHVPPEHDTISSFVVCMVREARELPLGESSNHACHKKYHAFNAVPELRVAMYPGVGNCGINLGQWFSALLGPWKWSNVTQGPTWWQGAVFAVRTCRLLITEGRVNDSYYRLLQAQVDWHVNPEAGHFFERSWYFVFPPLTQTQSAKGDEEPTG